MHLLLIQGWSPAPPDQLNSCRFISKMKHRNEPDNLGLGLYNLVLMVGTTTFFFFFFLSPGGTGVLWWLYAKQRRSPKETVIPEQLQIAEDNLRALLIYAISATVFTVSSGYVGYPRLMFLLTGDFMEQKLTSHCCIHNPNLPSNKISFPPCITH